MFTIHCKIIIEVDSFTKTYLTIEICHLPAMELVGGQINYRLHLGLR